MASGTHVKKLKPIVLYDHLPGILIGYPAVIFMLIAGVLLPYEFKQDGSEWWQWWPDTITPHLAFWFGLSVMLVWYVAFRFNMPKSKFWLVFGLFGTFIGIPIVLEIANIIHPFSSMGKWLGYLAPEVNSAAWFVLSLLMFGMWFGNLVWSRTHMRVRIDESGLTVNRIGGKGERFELIGLKVENEPLDYLELFIGGIGSLSLKTRMNRPIFTMKRVVGLYRSPIFPFFQGKLSKIEEMLSYQGKVLSVDPNERAEIAEGADADAMEEEDGMEDGQDEFDSPIGDDDGYDVDPRSPDIN